jgi:hypothetical protein
MKALFSFLFLSLALLAGCATKSKPAGAAATSTEPSTGAVDTASVLKTQLKKDYQIRTADKNTEARYCPDDTCELMKVPETTNPEVLNDFAFLYLGRHSKYERVKKFQQGTSEAAVAQVMGKYKSLCPEAQLTTKCVLKGMTKKYSIRLLSLKYDEGDERVAPLRIE